MDFENYFGGKTVANNNEIDCNFNVVKLSVLSTLFSKFINCCNKYYRSRNVLDIYCKSPSRLRYTNLDFGEKPFVDNTVFEILEKNF